MFQKDLTKGPVFQTMCAFALPMILGNLLQQGYNLVDTWVVGRFVGPGALAAVGSAFALMTFLTSVLLGLCMGSGVVFSLCFGSRNPQRLQSSIASAFALTAALGGLLTACALLGVDGIIRWMNIPGEIAAMAREYLILVFWGIPAIALYNFFGAYLKALGDSVVPLLFLGLSTALNIGLDILLVAVWRQGAAGAAAATVIAQYISGIGIALYTLWKNQPLRQAFKSFRVEKAGLGEIVRYSFLTCLQQSVMNLGILMVQGLVNSFGTTVMAAFAAGVKIDSFAYMPAQEFGNAFSTFIAQNRGAGETGRIKKGVRWGVLTSVSYCLLVSLALWFLAKPLMLIFVDASQTAIIAQGVQYLRIIGPFYCGIGCLFLLYGLYRALGRPAVSVVLTIISLGTRVALSYALSAIPALGVIGIWWSIPIGWALADAVGLLLYLKKRRLLLGEPV
ncbi:MAG: MATE family efflux transporter [Acutalibacter sp.]|nr:MATE family efflux transporter [Acutalibacter sp.]MCI8921453.1 MATE family efflux transporter [Acutalibacter sp.]